MDASCPPITTTAKYAKHREAIDDILKCKPCLFCGALVYHHDHMGFRDADVD